MTPNSSKLTFVPPIPISSINFMHLHLPPPSEPEHSEGKSLYNIIQSHTCIDCRCPIYIYLFKECSYRLFCNMERGKCLGHHHIDYCLLWKCVSIYEKMSIHSCFPPAQSMLTPINTLPVDIALIFKVVLESHVCICGQ